MLVCSKSTRDYFPEEMNIWIVDGITTDSILTEIGMYNNITAVGGGAVIDVAKIISSDPIVCYPTTASGSCYTSHSVYWEGTVKRSLKRRSPWVAHIVEKFVNDIPDDVKEYTTYDAISHCLDSMWSIYTTRKSLHHIDEALEILKGSYSNAELVYAGGLAGKAIEICPTTLLHSLSYPLTGIYGVPHGKALGYLLPEVCEYMNFDLSEYISYPRVELDDIDLQVVIEEGLRYNKIYDTKKKIDLKILKEILKCRNGNKM